MWLALPPLPVVPCDVAAYVIDHDPNGTNVRAAPGSTAIVGRLPNDDSVAGVRVHITGASGDWLRIDRATEQGADRARTFFKGSGWIYAPLLGTDGVGWVTGGTPLRAEPNASARIVTRMLAGGDGATVRGCRGTWLHVEHHKVRGWAEGKHLCDNSLTTCS